MAVINIEVVSDIVCVWCFVGKRSLERAISLYRKTYPGGKDDDIRIIWRPYYLNHNEGASVDKSVLRDKKFADWSDVKVSAAMNRLEQVGRSVGINFKHGGKIGHTRDAHRLIHFVQTNGVGEDIADRLVEKIFEAYHEQERDISDQQVLRDIAVDAGLDGKEVKRWLESDEAIATVDEEARVNFQRVTHGVPTFILQGEYRVDGAQDVQELVEAIIKVKDQEARISS